MAQDMSTDERAAEFLSGKLSNVDVAAIEKELRNLWKEAAHGDPDEGVGTVVRACALNLILMSNEEDAESVCSDLLDDIEQGHPCRSILAIFRPGKPQRLNAWVSARCHVLGASKQICSEQITVCCDGGKPQQLASVVRPLVVPDLPVFVWWRPTKITWNDFAGLHACARRFIVDSSRAPFDHQLLIDAAGVIAENQHCLFVSDLCWRRLHAWCRAAADSFDGFPMPIGGLAQISSVKITCSSNKQAVSNHGLLFAGWLASRLGWQPKAMKGDAVEFATADNRKVNVSFTAEPADTASGDLQSVEMQFSSKLPTLHISTEVTPEAVFVVARNAETDQKEATRVAQQSSEAVLMGQELEVLTQDPIYEESANMAALIITMRKENNG